MSSKDSLSASNRLLVGYSLGAAVTAVGLSALGYTAALAPGGQNLWWLGFILTAVLFGFAVAERNRLKAVPLARHQAGDAVLVLALIVSLASIGGYGVQYFKDQAAIDNPDAIGACWALQGEQMISTPCDNPNAGFSVDRYEDMWQKCDDYFVASAKNDKYLCLSPLR